MHIHNIAGIYRFLEIYWEFSITLRHCDPDMISENAVPSSFGTNGTEKFTFQTETSCSVVRVHHSTDETYKSATLFKSSSKRCTHICMTSEKTFSGRCTLIYKSALKFFSVWFLMIEKLLHSYSGLAEFLVMQCNLSIFYRL